MLTAEELDAFVDPITSLWRRYEDSVLQDIARRLGKLNLTSSAAWQMQRLSESGMLYDDILKQLSEITGESERTLRSVFTKAGVRAMRFDDAIYKKAGLKPLLLNLSPAMADVLSAGLSKTNNLFRNLTLTTAIGGQNAFIDAADLAYMQISTGAMSYQEAISLAVKSLAEKGLSTINYASGRMDQLDVAVRRAALTSINQTVGIMQSRRADEMGSDLVQTSAHVGARPTHQVWQGKIFSRSGTSKKYPPFIENTGYGRVDGLLGINCRHSFYPYFEGLSKAAYDQATLDQYANKTVMYQGKNLGVYEATQEQRYIERKIRYWKRQEGALNAAGADSSFESAKVKAWQSKMRDFIKQTGLDRDRFREQVLSGGPSRKTVGFSFLSGESHLATTAEARALGESAEGWVKHERNFQENYLDQFKVKDKVDRTIGFWGGPEPSFNAYLIGERKNVIEMAKEWGKNYNQQAIALLFPNSNGEGGKLIWDFGRDLTNGEMDTFFKSLDSMNKELNEKFNEYFGVTVKRSQTIEYWFSSEAQRLNAYEVINNAFRRANFKPVFRRERGFDFVLLFQGSDY